MDKRITFILKHVWWLVVLLAVLLLVAHSFKTDRIVVDNTSVVLLILILLSPFGAAIKKIKFGGLEAEIDPSEVNKVTAEAEKSLAAAPPRPMVAAPKLRAAEAIGKLAETDMVIALAKLRIELEARLRRLHQWTDHALSPRAVNVIQILRDLQAAQILTPQLGLAIRDVMSICNRAIHGEEIRDVDSRRIIEAGTAMLDELDQMASQRPSANPHSKEVISAAEVERARAARYRLTAIVPYVNNPERRTYDLTQEGLDEFFENYGEFAEFVARVEEIPSAAESPVSAPKGKRTQSSRLPKK